MNEIIDSLGYKTSTIIIVTIALFFLSLASNGTKELQSFVESWINKLIERSSPSAVEFRWKRTFIAFIAHSIFGIVGVIIVFVLVEVFPDHSLLKAGQSTSVVIAIIIGLYSVFILIASVFTWVPFLFVSLMTLVGLVIHLGRWLFRQNLSKSISLFLVLIKAVVGVVLFRDISILVGAGIVLMVYPVLLRFNRIIKRKTESEEPNDTTQETGLGYLQAFLKSILSLCANSVLFLGSVSLSILIYAAVMHLGLWHHNEKVQWDDAFKGGEASMFSNVSIQRATFGLPETSIPSLRTKVLPLRAEKIKYPRNLTLCFALYPDEWYSDDRERIMWEQFAFEVVDVATSEILHFTKDGLGYPFVDNKVVVRVTDSSFLEVAEGEREFELRLGVVTSATYEDKEIGLIYNYFLNVRLKLTTESDGFVLAASPPQSISIVSLVPKPEYLEAYENGEIPDEKVLGRRGQT